MLKARLPIVDQISVSPEKAGWKPRMRRPGLINMKLLAIKLGPRFAAQDPHFMDHLEEMALLSNGRRTIREIARIIGYEIGPAGLDVVVAMFEALAQLGFLTFENAQDAPGGQGR